MRLSGETSSDDHPPPRSAGPQTAEEAEILAAYRATDDAGRVIVWAALLAELGRRSLPPEDAEKEPPPGP